MTPFLTGWQLLAVGFPEVKAHALSVNANGNIFILDQHGSVREYVRFGEFEEFGLWTPWYGYINSSAIAIDACTFRDGNGSGDLVYAAIPPDSGSDFQGVVDWDPLPDLDDTSGTGHGDSPGWWWADWGNKGWHDTAIVTGQLSGASGSTKLYAALADSASAWHIDAIDWGFAWPWHRTYICPTLPS
jgi:hypothetical protein